MFAVSVEQATALAPILVLVHLHQQNIDPSKQVSPVQQKVQKKPQNTMGPLLGKHFPLFCFEKRICTNIWSPSLDTIFF